MRRQHKEIGGLKITHHALVRFLERCLKYDLNMVRGENDARTLDNIERTGMYDLDAACNLFISEALWSKIFETGTADGTYVQDDWKVVIIDRHIVTVSKFNEYTIKKHHKNKTKKKHLSSCPACDCSYRKMEKRLRAGKVIEHAKKCPKRNP